jgi:hypothetical protein
MWYRLYELDEGDHILKAISLEFSDDAQAVAAAQSRAGPYGVELWEGSRRIGRIERSGRVDPWLNAPSAHGAAT